MSNIFADWGSYTEQYGRLRSAYSPKGFYPHDFYDLAKAGKITTQRVAGRTLYYIPDVDRILKEWGVQREAA